MRSIHPQNFITIASIVLEICSGQKSSIKKKKSKGNNSKLRQARVKVHVHSTSPLMRSIHPQNFTTIASLVLEICSGQNSSMKKFKYEKKTKGNNSKNKQARVEVHVHCTPP